MLKVMKKIIALIILPMLILVGCSKKEFNSPALLGKKDGERWKAVDYRAHIDDNGVLKITGTDGAETLTLVIPSATITSSDLKEALVAEAIFTDATGNMFSTKNKPHPSISLYPADGTIELVEYSVINNTVTGLFNFNAYRVDGLQALNFSAGNFYQVPITGGVIDTNTGGNGGEECEKAKVLTKEAQTIFIQISDTSEPGSEEYIEACVAYKAALVNQIALCSDVDGSLQKIIDSLGDCKGGDDGEEPEEDSFYADLNGVEFEEDLVVGQIETQQGFTGIVLGGSIGTDGNAIGMVLPTNIVEGSYTGADLQILALAWSYYLNKDTRSAAVPETIKLKIIKHDMAKKFIKATFEFDAVDENDPTKKYKITNGAISVSYN